MSKIYDFLKECDHFVVVSKNGDFPAARPFGAIMEKNEYLYISTSIFNDAHKQIKNDGNIQIVAVKPRTRQWLRITSQATECTDLKIKFEMFEACPKLKKHFDSAKSSSFILFKIKVLKSEFK